MSEFPHDVGCYSKVRHKSRAHALKAIERMRSATKRSRFGAKGRDEIRPVAKIHVYSCPNCGGWHIGQKHR